MSEKEQVLEILGRLPDNAGFDAILEEIRVLAGIRVAEEQSECGQTVSHDEVVSRISEWAGR